MLAAVGPNADAFAPPAATEFVVENKFCPPYFLFFLQRVLTALSMDSEIASPSPAVSILPSHLARCILYARKFIAHRAAPSGNSGCITTVHECSVLCTVSLFSSFKYFLKIFRNELFTAIVRLLHPAPSAGASPCKRQAPP